jgi:hypothetical protein
MTGYVDNITKVILLHVNVRFGVELLNLLLLSYKPRPVIRKDTTLTITNSARTQKLIEGKDFI